MLIKCYKANKASYASVTSDYIEGKENKVTTILGNSYKANYTSENTVGKENKAATIKDNLDPAQRSLTIL